MEFAQQTRRVGERIREGSRIFQRHLTRAEEGRPSAAHEKRKTMANVAMR